MKVKESKFHVSLRSLKSNQGFTKRKCLKLYTAIRSLSTKFYLLLMYELIIYFFLEIYPGIIKKSVECFAIRPKVQCYHGLRVMRCQTP